MQDKIIKLFYDDIYSEFTINELATKTKISYSYVHRQVEELEGRGYFNRKSAHKS
ncbi:MAG: winged helix-turn-helix domain-containing protein [bacterium]